MPYIEKYLPQALNLDDAEQALEKTDARYLYNTRSLSATQKGLVETAIGNEKVTALESLLPVGSNACVGVASDRSRMVMFMYNSSAAHGIYLYELQLNRWSKVLQWAGLNFKNTENITACSLAGDFLTWCSSGSDDEPRMISLKQNVSNLSAETVALCRLPPAYPLTVTRIATGFSRNLVGAYSWQFSYRYIYEDFSHSVFAPYSDLMPADAIYDEQYNQNGYRLNFTLLSQAAGHVIAVEFAYRKGNTGEWRLFETLRNPAAGALSVDFNNRENAPALATGEVDKPFQPIPRALAHAHYKGRHFFAGLTFGRDIQGLRPTISLSLTKTSGFGSSWQVVKPGGVYTVGMYLLDAQMRSTGVVTSHTIAVPRKTPGTAGFSGISDERIQVAINMAAPAWAAYARLCITRNKTDAVYMQVSANYFFYYGEYNTEQAGFTVPAGVTALQGKLFRTAKPATRTTYRYVYLQLPFNAALVATTDMSVRILDPVAGVTRTEPILEVVGDWIVVDDFGIGNWSAVTQQSLLIEVYKRNSQDEEVFYDTGPTFAVSAGRININTQIKADAYRLGLIFDQRLMFKFLPKEKDRQSDPDLAYTVAETAGPVIYAPTIVFDSHPTTTEVKVQQSLTGLEVDRGKWYQVFKGTEFKPVFSYDFVQAAGYALDYTQIASSLGRPVVKIPFEREVHEPTAVTFTDPYIEGTLINGLSEISSLNRESLGIDRSPIRKLIVAGQVLLAIHERAVSSLYIGEGFIRQGEDAILAKTVSVIGDERELQGGYGTLHPESVCQYQGQVFFFDSLNGAVCRYTQAGIYPISEYKLREHFQGKARKYDSVRVIGSIDAKKKQYLLTFPRIGTTVMEETIAFHIPSERWECYYGWQNSVGVVPERSGTVGTELYTFLGGKGYVHNRGGYLFFYGSYQKRVIRLVMAPAPDKDKRFLNLHIRADSLAEGKVFDAKVIDLLTSKAQESFIPSGDIALIEGVYYMPVLCEIQNNLTASQNNVNLRQADELTGRWLQVSLETDKSERAALHSLHLVFQTEEYSD